MIAAMAAPWRRVDALASWAAFVALGLAVLALLLLAAGPIGWRAGWWHYRVGLQVLMPVGGCLGLAAISMALPVLGLAACRPVARRGVMAAGLALLLGGSAAYFPWHWNNQRGGSPRVNDVTTDTASPPSLAFAEPERRAEGGNPSAYGGAETAARQRNFYPDIAPVVLDRSPAQAFAQALAVAQKQNWTILKADAAAGVIEAGDRSRWFGFADDIAVRVSPFGEGSRIDIRSAARQGRGDYGVNVGRVRGFLAQLREAAGAK